MRFSNVMLDGLDEEPGRGVMSVDGGSDVSVPVQKKKESPYGILSALNDLAPGKKLDVRRYGVTDPTQSAMSASKKKTTIDEGVDSGVKGAAIGAGLSVLASILSGSRSADTVNNLLPVVRNLGGFMSGADELKAGADREHSLAVKSYYDRLLDVDKFNAGVDKDNTANALKVAGLQQKAQGSSATGHTFTDAEGNVHEIIFDKNGSSVSSKPVLDEKGVQLKGNPSNAQDDMVKKFQGMSMITDLKNKKEIAERKLVGELSDAQSAMAAVRDPAKKERFAADVKSIKDQLRKLRLDSHAQLRELQKGSNFDISPWEDFQTKDMTPEERKAYGIDNDGVGKGFGNGKGPGFGKKK